MKRFYYVFYNFGYTWALIPSLSVQYSDGSSGYGVREITASLEFLKWNLRVIFVIAEGYRYE
jgi:hypothetical protein